ncbi:MAG: carboxynorspermidine decarboxylase [Lachnospiraceae bacterium]|nr:carboxynorspermidine decarboxylase [Lachnospiraceae bacterium]
MSKFTLETLPTPAYIVRERDLLKNLEILNDVQKRTGCKILLAQKCFSMFYEYPLIAKYISGATASGLFEARLGFEKMRKETGERCENHVFSPAFREEEFEELMGYVDHISFNSLTQLEKYKEKTGKVSFGLRINPECSTQGDHAIYDPCAPGSRLGVTSEKLKEAANKQNTSEEATNRENKSGERETSKTLNSPLTEEEADFLMSGPLKGMEGLHFHTLCEQNSDDLETTLKVVTEKFGPLLKKMKWLNMGGGHHITREDYDVERLVRLINKVKEEYGVEVYLEPGEAVALNAGLLKTKVLDIVENSGITTLVLDASAACHMPDVLEMPYRPPLKDSGKPEEKAYTYRLSSFTCLAGDIIGDYSFDKKVNIGDCLYFEDMAIYSMVKNNTFNGIGLPIIAAEHTDGSVEIVKSFGYEDFKMRLS